MLRCGVLQRPVRAPRMNSLIFSKERLGLTPNARELLLLLLTNIWRRCVNLVQRTGKTEKMKGEPDNSFSGIMID